MPPIEQATEAKQEKTEEFLGKRNVVGVAVGYKNQLGEQSGDASVVVLVQEKKPLAALEDEDIIPKEINGVPTDVVEIGFMRAHQAINPQQRFRPVVPLGASISHFRVGAGTLGLIVRDRRTGQQLLLSNNHVMANSNDAAAGDDILQPGTLDGGDRVNDSVAKLERFQPLAYIEDAVVTPQPAPTQPSTPTDPTVPSTPPSPTDSGCDIVEAVVALANVLADVSGSTKRVQSTLAGAQAATSAVSQVVTGGSPAEVPMIASSDLDNLLDAALARPIDPTMFSNDILGIGPVNGVGEAELGMEVAKTGRTTGYTEGSVTLLDATINVQYDTLRGTRTARFVNQIVTSGMSKRGDSGSLVVQRGTNTAVGLLFAGSEFASVFTPITRVFSILDIEL